MVRGKEGANSEMKRLVAILLLLCCVVRSGDALAKPNTDADVFASVEAIWAQLDAAEDEALAAGLSGAALTAAVREAALACQDVDAQSVLAEANGFSFQSCNGAHLFYDSSLRELQRSGNEAASRNVRRLLRTTSSSANVLLIGPYYGYDEAFTDFYANLADRICAASGGSVALLSGTEATAAAICEALPAYGVVLFDGHGALTNGCSYLCVRSTVGISSADIIDGSAVSLGSGQYGINGSFLTKHLSEELPCSLVWLSSCYSMDSDGLCAPLIECGAGVVYGYAGNVRYDGDHAFADSFYAALLTGETVASSIAAMKEAVGLVDPAESDPQTAARPFVCSERDKYPDTLTADQTVLSDWTLTLAAPTATPEPTASATPTATLEPTASATASPSPTPALLYGDANLDHAVRSDDASCILRYCVKLCELNALALAQADIDGAAGVTTADAAVLLRYLVRLEPRIPL